jgi:hypothetical protein
MGNKKCTGKKDGWHKKDPYDTGSSPEGYLSQYGASNSGKLTQGLAVANLEQLRNQQGAGTRQFWHATAGS